MVQGKEESEKGVSRRRRGSGVGSFRRSETVRDEIQLTLDENPQSCKECFLSWIVSDDEVKKM